MKIMFVYPGFEYLGIEYLSAILKQHGFQTKLAFDPQLFNDSFLKVKYLDKFFSYEDVLLKQIKQYAPQLIAFSVLSSHYQWAISLARKIKCLIPSAHITFGGTHTSSVPDRVVKQDCVDSVVIGEGEFALLDLANALRHGKLDFSIKNIWFKNNGQIIKNSLRPYIDNLDVLPFPDKELYYKQMPSYYKRGYTVLTRRGCLNNCSFCYQAVLRGLYPKETKRVRLRSVDNVMAELTQAKKKYNYKQIRINDPLFITDKQWLKEFSQRYKREINVPSCCFSSLDILDEEVIRYLEDIKSYQICLGVQSVNLQVRRAIYHRPETNEQIIRAIELCRKHKIRVVVDNILGYPGEKESDLVEMAEFYHKHNPDRICTFWLTCYPKTPIVKMAKERGMLNDEDIERLEENPSQDAINLRSEIHPREKEKYHLLLVLYHFLPRGIYGWILRKRLYHLLPNINATFLDYIYTVFAKDRLDIPRKRYYIRYLNYIPQVLYNKLKRIKCK